MTTKITSVQVRKGTLQEWYATNPPLLVGEIGLETDTYRFKVGHRDIGGKLKRWSDLDYISPVSRLDKQVPAQAGDFWLDVEDADTFPSTGGQLYIFDGVEWIKIVMSLNPIFEGDTTIDGSLNMEQGCVVGNFNPCADNVYTLGVTNDINPKRWNGINLGTGDITLHFDEVVSRPDGSGGTISERITFTSNIGIGPSSDPVYYPPNYDDELNPQPRTPGVAPVDPNNWPNYDTLKNVPRLQWQGKDIALRQDFVDVTTNNIQLWRGTNENGETLPIPKYYKDLLQTSFYIIPKPNYFTLQYQSDLNEWFGGAHAIIDRHVSDLWDYHMQDKVVIGGYSGYFGSKVGQEDSEINNNVDQYRGASHVVVGPAADVIEIGREPLDTIPAIGDAALVVYNTTEIRADITANKFIVKGGTYQEFLRADGQISDQIPLVQSYWVTTPSVDDWYPGPGTPPVPTA